MMSDYDQMKLAKQIHAERVRNSEIRNRRREARAPIGRRADRRTVAGCPQRAAG